MRCRYEPVTAGIRYEFAFGTYEDALRMVGVRSEPRFAGAPVSAARIQHFAAMVQDGNPAFWDAEFATQVWGGLVAPPALLMGWLIPPPWLPDGHLGAPKDGELPATAPLHRRQWRPRNPRPLPGGRGLRTRPRR